MKDDKKELIFYSIIVVILVVICIFNNIFWKIGKEQKETINNTQETQLLEVNDITYNVPFEEEWLD